MTTLMTQLDLLTKHVIGGNPKSGSKSVNEMGMSGGKNIDDEQFEAMYNEEVQYLANQPGGSWPTFQRQVGNQGGWM